MVRKWKVCVLCLRFFCGRGLSYVTHEESLTTKGTASAVVVGGTATVVAFLLIKQIRSSTGSKHHGFLHRRGHNTCVEE